jgi:hypothetical protein
MTRQRRFARPGPAALSWGGQSRPLHGAKDHNPVSDTTMHLLATQPGPAIHEVSASVFADRLRATTSFEGPWNIRPASPIFCDPDTWPDAWQATRCATGSSRAVFRIVATSREALDQELARLAS